MKQYEGSTRFGEFDIPSHSKPLLGQLNIEGDHES